MKTDAIHWASVNLLRRDWPADGIDYHAQTKDRLGKIAKRFADAGRKDDAEKLKTVARPREDPRPGDRTALAGQRPTSTWP